MPADAVESVHSVRSGCCWELASSAAGHVAANQPEAVVTKTANGKDFNLRVEKRSILTNKQNIYRYKPSNNLSCLSQCRIKCTHEHIHYLTHLHVYHSRKAVTTVAPLPCCCSIKDLKHPLVYFKTFNPQLLVNICIYHHFSMFCLLTD